MGKSSISHAYETWRAALDHQPFAVLVYLSLRSLDSETPPVYYGGWEDIAAAARIPWEPEEPDLSDLSPEERQAAIRKRAAARKRAKNRVNKILQTLEAAGVIIRSGGAQAGQRQVIGLTLDPRITYTATGWTRRQRIRRGTHGQEETYYVPVPAWQAEERPDPRPATSEVGPPGPLSEGTGVLPEVGPEVPSEGCQRSPLRGDPKRKQEPVEEESGETGRGEVIITSQPNPGTRVRESNAMNDDDASPSRDKPEPVQTTELRAWAEANGWPMDATA